MWSQMYADTLVARSMRLNNRALKIIRSDTCTLPLDKVGLFDGIGQKALITKMDLSPQEGIYPCAVTKCTHRSCVR